MALALVDFSAEEKSFLSDPLAEQALARTGVLLDDLRPKPHTDADNPSRAAHLERRRQYKWRLVRDEFARLQAHAATHTASPAGRRASDPSDLVRASLEASLRRELAAAASTLQHEWQAEARRQQIEHRHASALSARMEIARRREHELLAKRKQLELRAEMRQARLAARAAGGAAAEGAASAAAERAASAAAERAASAAAERPASAPPSRPTGRGSGEASVGWQRAAKERLARAARQRKEELELQRQEELARKLAQKEQVVEERREQLAYEAQQRKVLHEARRLRHEEQKLTAESVEFEHRLALQKELLRKQELAARERSRHTHTRGGATVRENENPNRGGVQDDGGLPPAAGAKDGGAARARGVELEERRAAEERTRIEKLEARLQEHERAVEAQRRKEAAELRAKAALKELKRAAVNEAHTMHEAQRGHELAKQLEAAESRSREVKQKKQAELAERLAERRLRRDDVADNVERIHRAQSYKRAAIEANIRAKDERSEARRQRSEAASAAQRAMQAARIRRVAEMQDRLDAEMRQLSVSSPKAAPPAKPSPHALIDPRLVAVATGASPRRRVGAGRPSSAPPSRGKAPSAAPSGGHKPQQSHGAPPAARTSIADRWASSAEMERLARHQNEMLLRALEREQEREIERERLIASTPAGPDYKRLLKLLDLERAKANREIKRMAEDHELALARY
ncbi:hypothetical protein AB1Y20_002791 [Prymnesium parvum]|uniref:Uncharacterized protein n=1 Tax=Prymnesium parvum TaxID=97485 RepID=A0AB34JC61_PRYPA